MSRADEIRERLEKATEHTPEPWGLNDDLDEDQVWAGEFFVCDTAGPPLAGLFRHAPADLRWALARIERLEGALGEIAAPECPAIEHGSPTCRESGEPRSDWCEQCIARAALARDEKPL